MYESVVVPENKEYKKGDVMSSGKKKIIFNNSSIMHVTITAIDPATDTCVEVMVRKDALPDFIKKEK